MLGTLVYYSKVYVLSCPGVVLLGSKLDVAMRESRVPASWLGSISTCPSEVQSPRVSPHVPTSEFETSLRADIRSRDSAEPIPLEPGRVTFRPKKPGRIPTRPQSPSQRCPKRVVFLGPWVAPASSL